MERIETINMITAECYRQGVIKPEAIQYVLATVQHETNDTFNPVREAYWRSEVWRKRNLKYYPYYGRGYVQLTHKSNYDKFSKILGIDLVKNPNLALEPDIATFILLYGMKKGTFTGLRLKDFFNASGSNFIEARRIVNGKDKAEHIAELAQKIEISVV